jgi:hypothetical protein
MTCWRCSGSFVDATGCRTCGAPVHGATAPVATMASVAPTWEESAAPPFAPPPQIPGWSTTYVPGAVALPTQPPSRVAVRPPSTLATWLIATLAIGAAVDVLAVLAGGRYRGAIGGFLDGAVSEQQAVGVEAFYGNVGILQLLTFVPCVVLFLIWFSRIDAGARALGAVGFRHGHGWAVGAWFVPILNLFRPKQMVDDAWRAAEPALPVGAAIEGSPLPAWLGAWWATWLLGNLVSWRAMRLDGETLEELRTSVTVGMAADGLLVVAGVLAIVLVRSLTARLEVRASTQRR